MPHRLLCLSLPPVAADLYYNDVRTCRRVRGGSDRRPRQSAVCLVSLTYDKAHKQSLWNSNSRGLCSPILFLQPGWKLKAAKCNYSNTNKAIRYLHTVCIKWNFSIPLCFHREKYFLLHYLTDAVPSDTTNPNLYVRWDVDSQYFTLNFPDAFIYTFLKSFSRSRCVNSKVNRCSKCIIGE